MKKDELISELESYGIPVARHLLVDEMRAMVRQHRSPVRTADEMEEVEEKSILAKMRTMKREELVKECEGHDIEVTPNMIRGDLMMALRAWFREAGTAQTVLNFGRYTGMTFEEVVQKHQSYVDWVVKEMKKIDRKMTKLIRREALLRDKLISTQTQLDGLREVRSEYAAEASKA
jgi:hypothetical protein